MMKIIRTISDMRDEINRLQHKTIGFVPTMGYLHDGHLSLVKKAREENDIVIMSIFVNPLQFGPTEDLDRYPRDEERDTTLAKKHGVDILFLPTVEEMYPNPPTLQINIGHKSNVLCGNSRPGHFDGVAVVLAKLFHMTLPTNSYFGLKDAQQFSIVQSLIEDLNFPIRLIGLATVRDKDGLAKSSRNVYLTDEERRQATALYQALLHGKNLLVDGMKNTDTIKKEIISFLKKNTNGTIDYVDLLSYPNLTKIDRINEQIIIAVAVQFEQARLIDNIIVNENGMLVDRIDKGGI